MDKINSLKSEGSFSKSDPRFNSLDKIEYASERMVDTLENYILEHKNSPQRILIHTEKYAPWQCYSRLQRVLNEQGLKSELNYSSNGHVATKDDLELDLDSLVDEYNQTLEIASSRMISTLRSYLEVNEIEPGRILVKSKRYSFDPCFTRLQEEIDSKGLSTKLYHASVVKDPNDHDLVLDLDEIIERDNPDSLYRQDSLR
ncbi:MAG: hypothetical protein WC867_04570 [Candidatus Pacearchaeota archaeon]|jgi:hypothetical protein